MWALVDPDRPLESRCSKLIGRGHPIPDADERRCVGRFQVGLGSLVFHLLEKGDEGCYCWRGCFSARASG